MATSEDDNLNFSSEEDTADLFASPSHKKSKASSRTANAAFTASHGSSMHESRYDAETAREAALQRELEGVRNINTVIEGVLSSLSTAKGSMESVSGTVNNASTLLQTWTRILSQTEHNQRLILNEGWKGASDDVKGVEEDERNRRQAEERREREEERRKEEAKRRAEEEERARQAGTSSSIRGSRGRGRATRGSVTGTGRGYAGAGSQPSGRGIPAPRVRGTTGIGRGVGGSRGSTRGVR